MLRAIFIALAALLLGFAPTSAGVVPGPEVSVQLATAKAPYEGVRLAFWQSRDSNYNESIAVVPYQGPGDVSVGGATNNWYAWYSCARVYKASLASTSTNLCDLVDSAAPTTVICTLRGSASGLVDLVGTYCTGGLTPSAKCAVATGGVCNISQIYDQSGNSRPVVQATVANQPLLEFNALNGLPSIKCTAATCFMQTAASFTISQPITESGVFIEPTPGAAVATIIGNSSVAAAIGGSGNANQADISAGTQANVAATSNAWHAINGLLSGNSNCALNIDGTDSSGLTCGFNTFPGTPIRIMRGNGTQLVGSITETGLLAVSSSSTDRGNIRLNQKAYYNTP